MTPDLHDDSVRGRGVLPMIAANSVDGFESFIRAVLDFLAAAVLGQAGSAGPKYPAERRTRASRIAARLKHLVQLRYVKKYRRPGNGYKRVPEALKPYGSTNAEGVV